MRSRSSFSVCLLSCIFVPPLAPIIADGPTKSPSEPMPINIPLLDATSPNVYEYVTPALPYYVVSQASGQPGGVVE